MGWFKKRDYSCVRCEDTGIVPGVSGGYQSTVVCTDCREKCPECEGTGRGNTGQPRDLCDVCVGRRSITKESNEQLGDRYMEN